MFIGDRWDTACGIVHVRDVGLYEVGAADKGLGIGADFDADGRKEGLKEGATEGCACCGLDGPSGRYSVVVVVRSWFCASSPFS